MMQKIYIFFVVLVILLLFAGAQEDFGDNTELIDDEKCNDQDLYDIMMKAATRARNMNRFEIRQLTMNAMQEMYQTARSMGSICTSRAFQFPKGTNHRYCTVRHEGFKCHSIVF